jgi:hypothetical protein
LKRRRNSMHARSSDTIPFQFKIYFLLYKTKKQYLNLILLQC